MYGLINVQAPSPSLALGGIGKASNTGKELAGCSLLLIPCAHHARDVGRESRGCEQDAAPRLAQRRLVRVARKLRIGSSDRIGLEAH